MALFLVLCLLAHFIESDYKCWRKIGVALTWKFGGYTEKRRETVDTGRFKQ